MKKQSKKIIVSLRKSLIGEKENTKKCVWGLGLRKIRQQVVLDQTPSIEGMIHKAKHLLSVEYPPWQPMYHFQFKPGHEHAVVPVVGITQDECIEHIGSAFFINPGGVIATAKHVLEENPSLRPHERYKGHAVLQFCGEEGVARAITHASFHPKCDVAVGILEPAHDNCDFCTNHPCVSTMNLGPLKHELVSLYGYPHVDTLISKAKSIIDAEGNQSWVQRTRYRASWHIGLALSNHPDGLRLVKGECYKLSINMPGGLSGGPTFNSNGFVIGINSYGPNKIGECISSSINLLKDNELPPIADPNSPGSFISVEELRIRSHKSGEIPRRPVVQLVRNPAVSAD